VTASDWAFFDGTSMATPHVAGVAALVWSYHSSCSNDQIRAALQASAKDLGAAGRDVAYGFGLVQAKAAVDYLNANSCSGGGGDTGGGDTGGDTGGGGKGGGKGGKK
jgi:subtilisin family serine protease